MMKDVSFSFAETLIYNFSFKGICCLREPLSKVCQGSILPDRTKCFINLTKSRFFPIEFIPSDSWFSISSLYSPSDTHSYLISIHCMILSSSRNNTKQKALKCFLSQVTLVRGSFVSKDDSRLTTYQKCHLNKCSAFFQRIRNLILIEHNRCASTDTHENNDRIIFQL